MSGPALDLTKTDFVREVRDLTVFGTWITLEDEDEPCLAIVRTSKIGREGCVPCVVLLNEAYKYDDPKYGHRHLLETSLKFVKAMGLADNMANCHMVADAIHGHLLDLIKIPPRVREVNRSRGAEAMIVSPDGKKLSVEMYDNE